MNTYLRQFGIKVVVLRVIAGLVVIRMSFKLLTAYLSDSIVFGVIKYLNAL